LATEQGIVIKTGINNRTNMALVKTVQPSACEACSARSQCNPGTKGADRQVEAVNLVDAKEGDLIQISMDTGALLKAAFLLYVFPIICMLIGAITGHAIGMALETSPSAISASVGIGCFIAAMVLVRKQAGYMALKLKYQPKITRIIGHSNSDLPNACRPQATGGI
jgi:sigma-E factor negative regulatory protein RseC